MNKYLVPMVIQAWLCFGASSILKAEVTPGVGVLSVEHIGHTSFLITDQSGTVLVTDPFLSGYGSAFPGFLSVDLVLVSASGPDHDAVHQLRGTPVVLTPGQSSATIGGFHVEAVPIGSEVGCGYLIRNGGVKLLFLGEIHEPLPSAVLSVAEEADGVLAGFLPDAPAMKQLAGSFGVRTLVPVRIKPGSLLPTEFKDRPHRQTDVLKIGPKSPRQLVTLTTKLTDRASAASPGYSIFQDTLVELTWPQLQQAAGEKALVLVPVGVIEEHGPHMGLGADTYLTVLHCRRLKSALAALGIRALIAPPLYWGIADDTSGLPGSFNVRPETMSALIIDLCRSLEGWGFRRLVFVNEHGNRNHRHTLLDTLAKARRELNLEAFCLDAMMTGAAVYQARRTPGRYSPDYHAGAAETGVMWQEFPAEVDARLAQRLKPQAEFLPLGYVGDPASYLEEKSLSDYLEQAPVYDARRIQAFFAPKKTAPERAAARLTAAIYMDPKARAVLDRFIQAVGGSERLTAVQKQSRRGQLLDDNRTIPIEGVWSEEKWALNLQQAPGVIERFGFNGSFGWHAERGEVGQLPEPLVTAISMALDPQLALHVTDLFASLTLAPEEPAGEKSTVLEGETTAGGKARLTFDSATGFLLRFNDTTFEDYRDVDGVKYPFVITIRPGTRARFDRMENKVSLASADFEPPK